MRFSAIIRCERHHVDQSEQTMHLRTKCLECHRSFEFKRRPGAALGSATRNAAGWHRRCRFSRGTGGRRERFSGRLKMKNNSIDWEFLDTDWARLEMPKKVIYMSPLADPFNAPRAASTVKAWESNRKSRIGDTMLLGRDGMQFLKVSARPSGSWKFQQHGESRQQAP